MSNEHPDMHGNWVDGPDEEEPCCDHCGKPIYEWADLGCGHCDARHPEYGLLFDNSMAEINSEREAVRRLDESKDTGETKATHTFEAWCQAFDSWFKKTFNAGVESFTATTGAECWQEMYDEGMTPKQAYEEDISNAL